MSALPVVEDGEVTRLLNALGRGESLDPDAHHPLFTRVYASLHRIARPQRPRWKDNEPPNPSALLQDPYMQLVSAGGDYAHPSQCMAVDSWSIRPLLIHHNR